MVFVWKGLYMKGLNLCRRLQPDEFIMGLSRNCANDAGGLSGNAFCAPQCVNWRLCASIFSSFSCFNLWVINIRSVKAYEFCCKLSRGILGWGFVLILPVRKDRGDSGSDHVMRDFTQHTTSKLCLDRANGPVHLGHFIAWDALACWAAAR